MKTPLAIMAVLVAGVLIVPVAAHADTETVTTPIGSLEIALDGGSFTEECTDFRYDVVVTDAAPRVQWSVEIAAERDGGGSATGMLTDYGSGTFDSGLMICSGAGAGTWSATVSVRMADPADATAVYDGTTILEFTISKAVTTTTITRITAGGGRTKVKGSVTDAQVAMFGDVTVKVKKPGASWKTGGSGSVDADGNFSITIDRSYPSGTKFKAVFEGTDEARRSTSAVTTV